MMLDSKHGTSWSNDRFMLFLAIATVVHLAVFFGIHFGNLNPLLFAVNRTERT